MYPTRKNAIKDIHFRLTFSSLNNNFPNVEIVKIAPNDETREVGTRTETNVEQSGRGYNVSGDVKAGTEVSLLNINLNIEGHIKKKSESEVIEKIGYPKEILVTRSSGVGSDAIWEFKQGEARGWKGEYELNIYFRIRKPLNELQQGEGYYQVLPKIMINGRELQLQDKTKIPPVPLFIVLN